MMGTVLVLLLLAYLTPNSSIGKKDEKKEEKLRKILPIFNVDSDWLPKSASP